MEKGMERATKSILPCVNALVNAPSHPWHQSDQSEGKRASHYGINRIKNNKKTVEQTSLSTVFFELLFFRNSCSHFKHSIS